MLSEEVLMEIEGFLTDAVRSSGCLTFEDLQPPCVVQQISRSLAEESFIWLGKETYVPNQLVGYLLVSDPQKLGVLEAIFNSPKFIKLLTQYIAERGFKLFEPLTVKIDVGDGEVMGDSRFMVEFCWSTTKDLDHREHKEDTEFSVNSVSSIV